MYRLALTSRCSQLGPHHERYFCEKRLQLWLYTLEFAKGKTPPLSSVPIPFDSLKVESVQSLLREAVDVSLRKGAIEPLEDDRSPGFYSHLFLIPQKDGGNQLVINLLYHNQFLQVDHFKMETSASIMAAICQNDWATLIDLRDAYSHIPMAKRSKKYLCFVVNSKVYQFHVLCSD